MNQEMFPCFPPTPTHAAPTSHGITSPHQIIASEDLPPSCCPHKESYPSRSFNPPNGFPRKLNINLSNKSMVERLGIKSSMLSKSPPHDIRALMAWDLRMNESEKIQHLIHLPINKIPDEREVPYTFFTPNRSA